ncbi:MAG TPA: hypothetical protein VJ841_03165 [Candidatus Saccharimonadales bacterium]|nr:hypothetical protein [Candidatus Saccharimonadales bacterium]
MLFGVKALRGELNAQLAGREVVAALGHSAGVIMHVCVPDDPFEQRRVFYWEVEVRPKADEKGPTWSLSFDALDTLGVMTRAATLTLFRRHISGAAWQ